MGSVRRFEGGEEVTWLTPAVRQWIYLVLTALLPILVGYGVVAETDVSLWLALAAAILGAGGTALAASHTPKDD
ncbi:hypothetical protein ACN95_14665 [Gordonia sihwensis]|nr:hypothetical protein [Gordonia sihwensis]